MFEKPECAVPENVSLDTSLLLRLLDNNCKCEDIAPQFGDNTFFHCDPFPVNHAFYTQFIYCFMFGLLVLVAVGGNLTVAWIILKHERMRTVSSYHSLNTL